MTEPARIMPERRISAWPVVAGDRLVGIVTGTDPMRFLVATSGTQDRDVTD